MTDQPIERAATVSAEVPLTATITVPLDDVLARYGFGSPDDGEGPEPDFYTNRSELTEAVARILVAEMDPSWKYGLRQRMDEVAREVVAEQLRPRIIEIFDQEITKTDGLGNPTSLPKPFRQMVMDEAINWANSRTDRYGGKETNLSKILTAQVDKLFTQECTAAVAEAKAKIKNVLAQHSAKILASSVEDIKLIELLAPFPDAPADPAKPPTF